MTTNTHDFNNIIHIVTLYFKGTYEGDSQLLKKAFHKDAHITGIINDTYYDWPLNEFISRVTVKPTPAMKGEKYDKEITKIDKTEHIAMVKANVNIGDIKFTDYITLLRIDGQWIIRSKSFIGSL